MCTYDILSFFLTLTIFHHSITWPREGISLTTICHFLIFPLLVLCSSLIPFSPPYLSLEMSSSRESVSLSKTGPRTTLRVPCAETQAGTSSSSKPFHLLAKDGLMARALLVRKGTSGRLAFLEKAVQRK